MELNAILTNTHTKLNKSEFDNLLADYKWIAKNVKNIHVFNNINISQNISHGLYCMQYMYYITFQSQKDNNSFFHAVAQQTLEYNGGKDLQIDVVNHISDNGLKYEVYDKL